MGVGGAVSDLSSRVGAHIRQQRQVRKLRLQDVADRTGLSVPYLSDVERGQQNASLKALERIAEGLGLRVHVLFIDGDAGL
jgi:transcriptional regulator with XRE-family HTH domain